MSLRNISLRPSAPDAAAPTTSQAPAVAPRAQPRTRVDISARCRCGHERFVGVITSLSESGLFLQSRGTLAVGATCSITPTDDPHIELRGRVRHVIHKGPGGRRGLGIELYPMDARTRAWLGAALLDATSFEA